MKRITSIVLSVILAVVMTMGSVGVVMADDSISITLNGQPLTFDQMPIMESDRVLVPMRGIFEALGAQVSWEEATETVTGKLGGTTVVLSIGNTNATVNGSPVTLDVPARLVNDRTLVPIRFISESLGAKVDWDDATQTVIIEAAASGKVHTKIVFDDKDSFVLDTDFVMGAEYQAENVSLSSEADHTTGSGKSLKMANRTKSDHRVKLTNVFSDADLGKTFIISAWMMVPNADDASVAIATYSPQGTTYAFEPKAYASATAKKGEWTQLKLEYTHDDASVTQLGFDQRPAGSKCVDLIYVDDIEIVEGSLPASEKPTEKPPVGEVTVVNGHRPVPTEFTRSNSLDDLIFYEEDSKNPEEILASLPKGEVVVDNDDLINGEFAGEYGTVETVKVDGQPFTEALRATVTTLPPNPYEFQIVITDDLKGKAEDGDVMLLQVSMRTLEGNAEAQTGQIQVVVEQPVSPNAKTITGNVITGKDWMTAYFPFTFQEGFTRLTVRLGYYEQVVEFGGYSITNYKKDISIDDLPKSTAFPALAEDAAWRKDALDRIEKIRKGDINVIVKDAAGNVVPNADVNVDMYEHEFQWGTALNPNLLTSLEYQNIVATYFNAAVLENQFKWCEYEKDPQKARDMVDKAKELGIKYMRGHTLVWDRVYKEGNTSVPADLPGLYNNRAALDERIRSHIFDEAGAFSGELADWDVLNEAVKNREMIKIHGTSIIKQWFDWAREADPHAMLYYNDYITNDTLFDVLDQMEEDGVDYDGIGIQSHYGSATDPVQIYEFYERLAKYGKRLKVTEYDFDTQDNILQANFTRDLMITAFSHEAMDGFIMWGFKSRADANRYVLVDQDYNPKPALEQWADLIYNKWWTREAGKTDANGQYSVRGYYGDYDITVTANGQTKTVSVPCYKGNDNTITVTLD